MVQQGWQIPPHQRGASPAFSRDIGAHFINAQTPEVASHSRSDLSDRELVDIGTTRGEIDYLVSNRG